MLSRLIRKEMLDHLMSLRFAIACVLCFTVMISSFFVRYQDYRQALGDYRENTIIDQNDLKDIWGPWFFIYGGIRIRQSPNPLKVFVRGVRVGNSPRDSMATGRPSISSLRFPLTTSRRSLR